MQSLAAAASLIAGATKHAGAIDLATFEEIGLGQWFRYFVGGLEMVGIMFEKHSIEERDGSDLQAFVLAGGEGTRLQSLTHKIDGDLRPKQFSRIFDSLTPKLAASRRVALESLRLQLPAIDGNARSSHVKI